MIPFVYAFLADLESSRVATEREDLGRAVERAIEAVNQDFREDWVAPLETTKGLDELSGALRRADRAFDVAVRLNVRIWPARFRFGLGAGAVDVGSVGDRASDLDGPALHHAADALRRAGSAALPLALHASVLDDPSLIELVEAAALLHHTILRSWKPRTARVARVLDELGGEGVTQSEMAARLAMTQQGVSDALRRANRKELFAAEHAIRDCLARSAARVP